MEQPQAMVEDSKSPTNGEANNGTNHLDEIARSLKVPSVTETQSGSVPGGTVAKPAGGEKDDTAAVNLLLGMSNDTEDEKPLQRAAQEGTITGNQQVRRSERRRPSAGGLDPNPDPTTAKNVNTDAVLRGDGEGPTLDQGTDEETGTRPKSKQNQAQAQKSQAQAEADHPGWGDSKPPVVAPTALTLDPLQQILALDPAAAAGGGDGGGGGTAPIAVTTTRQGSGTSAAQKSELTLLCERFVHQFGHLEPDGSPAKLMLNDVAEALGVARRRLYDVINVFESIEVMQRVGKLMYEFCGYDHLPALLEQLFEEEKKGIPVEDRIRRAPAVTAAATSGEETQAQQQAQAQPQPQAQQQAQPQPQAGGQGNRSTSHSLWVLSRRLVRMLLMSHGPIALTAAAAVLVGPAGVTDPSEHRSQTQITVERRLYDIGSILCSLGLVDRVYIKKRQPAFEWVYGWRPGDSHPPPELAVAVMSRQPAPPLPIMPRRITGEGGGSASGGASRSGGGGKRGSGSRGGGGKRQRGEQGGAASAGMLPLAGLPPYGLPPMPPLGSPFPQNVLAAMSGLTPPPGTGGGGAGTGIGTTGSGGVDAGDKAQLAMAQLLSNPALFNPMAMGMSLPGIMPGADLNLTAPFGFGPGSEANNIPLQGSMTGLNVSKEGGLKAGGEGDAAAGANGGEGTVAAPAVPGSEGVPGEAAGLSPDMATMQQLAAFMWPPMFMHPAMLQMQQMAAAAGGTVGTGGGGEGGGQQDGTQSLPPPIPPTEGMDAALGGGGFGMQFLNPLLQGMVPLPGQLPTAPGVPGAAEAGAAEAGGGENHQAPPSSAPEPATDAPQDVSGGGPAEGDAQKEPNPPETGIEASNPEGQ